MIKKLANEATEISEMLDEIKTKLIQSGKENRVQFVFILASEEDIEHGFVTNIHTQADIARLLGGIEMLKTALSLHFYTP